MGFIDRVTTAVREAFEENMVVPWMKAGSVAVAGGTLAIPITNGVVLKTTGGVEALTLANGEPGQLLKIILDVDGGNGTLTPTTKTGFATIVFGDAKDQVTLLYMDATLGWVIQEASGLLAPPVIT